MSDLENGKSMSHFMCSILSSDIWHLKKSSGSMRIISICIVRPCRRGYESILVACKFMSRYKFGFISTWDENIFQCFYMDDRRDLLPLTQKENEYTSGCLRFIQLRCLRPFHVLSSWFVWHFKCNAWHCCLNQLSSLLTYNRQ